MNEKKKSLWNLLNPFAWLAAIFSPLLRFLGLMPPPQTTGFENTTKEDVDEAAKLAREQEAAVEEISRQMSPGEIVRAYARADASGRAEMNLAALSFDQQEWLLRLSDEDLVKLSMSTTAACARSLEARQVKPAYARPRPEQAAPVVLRTPTTADIEEAKREEIAELFRQVQRELFHAPGVPNLNPKHSRATLH